tara:strand:+ start:1069 stop:1317 length:249 start_codon:yes stop_codon:yes gene_type:complete
MNFRKNKTNGVKMSKKTKKQDEQIITIDGTDYKVSDLTGEQVVMVNHVADLSNKENSMTFNLIQIQGGKSHFIALLKESLSA